MAHYILSKTLTQLLTLYKDPDEVSLRAPVLTSMSFLLSALAPLPSTSSTAFSPPALSHLNGESPLEPFRDDLLSIFASGSRSAFSRAPAMQGLVDLIKIPGFLLASEVAFCVGAINDVLSKPESEEEYTTALDGLVVVAKLYPGIIEISTLPLLFAQLPNTAPASGSNESTSYRRALESLASLCLHPHLFEILANRLLAKLEFVCGANFDEVKEHSRNGLYAHHLLATLRAVLKVKVGNGDVDVGKYVDHFLPKLFGIFVLPTLDVMDKGEVAKDKRLLVDASKVVTSILQRVEVELVASLSVIGILLILL